MSEFSQSNCEVCTADTPKVTDDELKELMTHIPDWNIITRNNMMQLEKTFQFKNFVSALNFTNKIGDIAEQHGHHPAILTEWGKVTVSWWTHSVSGLHRNDFIMAAKTNYEYSAAS